jgi:predicted dehydrogenase
MRKKSGVIKVGIIGAGGIARGAHIPSYQRLKDVEIMAVCDINEEAAKQAAKDFNIPRVFSDYNDLLKLRELDAVSVCTPNAFHAPATIAALNAGKHVLCEKPMALNAKEGKAMVDAAKKNKKLLQVGFHMRFEAGSQLLKRFIEVGELGEIYYARAIFLRRRGIPSWGVFTRKDLQGGGALVDIGVHILDLVIWLMGSPKPVSVSGMACTKFGNREGIVNPWGKWDVKKFDVDDFAVAFVKFNTGAGLILETSWAANVDNPGSSMILGTEGGCQLDPPKIYKQQRDTLVDLTPIVPRGEEGHNAEVRRFIEAIREGLPSPVPGEEALEINKIMDGIYESSETGREVRIK